MLGTNNTFSSTVRQSKAEAAISHQFVCIYIAYKALIQLERKERTGPQLGPCLAVSRNAWSLQAAKLQKQTEKLNKHLKIAYQKAADSEVATTVAQHLKKLEDKQVCDQHWGICKLQRQADVLYCLYILIACCDSRVMLVGGVVHGLSRWHESRQKGVHEQQAQSMPLQMQKHQAFEMIAIAIFVSKKKVFKGKLTKTTVHGMLATKQ